MTGFVGMLPWFLPMFAVAAVCAAFLTRPVARRLEVRPLLAFALLSSFGAVLAATLPPDGTPSDPSLGALGCDLRRFWPASPGEYLAMGEVGLNVVLFVPLGICLALLPRSRARSILLLGTIALPFAIELTQLLVRAAYRGCESADVVDNLVGLGVGLALGVSGRELWRRGRVAAVRLGAISRRAG